MQVNAGTASFQYAPTLFEELGNHPVPMLCLPMDGEIHGVPPSAMGAFPPDHNIVTAAVKAAVDASILIAADAASKATSSSAAPHPHAPDLPPFGEVLTGRPPASTSGSADAPQPSTGSRPTSTGTAAGTQPCLCVEAWEHATSVADAGSSAGDVSAPMSAPASSVSTAAQTAVASLQPPTSPRQEHLATVEALYSSRPMMSPSYYAPTAAAATAAAASPHAASSDSSAATTSAAYGLPASSPALSSSTAAATSLDGLNFGVPPLPTRGAPTASPRASFVQALHDDVARARVDAHPVERAPSPFLPSPRAMLQPLAAMGGSPPTQRQSFSAGLASMGSTGGGSGTGLASSGARAAWDPKALPAAEVGLTNLSLDELDTLLEDQDVGDLLDTTDFDWGPLEGLGF